MVTERVREHLWRWPQNDQNLNHELDHNLDDDLKHERDQDLEHDHNIDCHKDKNNREYYHSDEKHNQNENIETALIIQHPRHGRYKVYERFAGGHYGEVWRATKVGDKHNQYIIKRVFGERGEEFMRSGWREVYFGHKIRGAKHTARFVESVYEKGRQLWLVFVDEGKSLHSLIYDTRVDPMTKIVRMVPSKFWQQVKFDMLGLHDYATGSRTTANELKQTQCTFCVDFVRRKALATLESIENIGNNALAPEPVEDEYQSMQIARQRISEAFEPHADRSTDGLKLNEHGSMLRSLVQQLLTSIDELHDLGCSHRDIKPANLIISGFDPAKASEQELVRFGYRIDGDERFEMKLCDFGSAVDSFSAQDARLYPGSPSVDELSIPYAPPETRLAGEAFNMQLPATYDMFSAGVVILELLIGSPNVFRVSDKTLAKLELLHAKHSTSASELERNLFMASLVELCVVDTQDGECNVEIFAKRIAELDPLGIGFAGDTRLAALVRRMLEPNPSKRIAASDALESPYFIQVNTNKGHAQNDINNLNDGIAAEIPTSLVSSNITEL